MCWQERTKLLSDFRLPIFDYGEKQMHKTSRMRFAFFCSDNRKSKIQNRKLVGIVALAVAFAMCGAVAAAQQPKKVSRIGFLTARLPFRQCRGARGVAFRQGLRELGWLREKILSLSGDLQRGKSDRLPALAAELVRLKLDVIVVTGGPTATLRRQASDHYDSHRHDAG